MSNQLRDAGKLKAEMDRRIREFLEKEIGEFTKETGLNVSGVDVYMRMASVGMDGPRYALEYVSCKIE